MANEANAITMCLGKVTLAAGTTTTLSNTGTTTYAVKSKPYTKAAMANAASPTTDVNSGAAFNALAASQACLFLVGLDKDGNVKVAQGNIVDLNSDNSLRDLPNVPGLPPTVCPIGYVLAKNGSTGSSWTFGSSNWTATGMTAVFGDLVGLPESALSS